MFLYLNKNDPLNLKLQIILPFSLSLLVLFKKKIHFFFKKPINNLIKKKQSNFLNTVFLNPQEFLIKKKKNKKKNIKNKIKNKALNLRNQLHNYKKTLLELYFINRLLKPLAQLEKLWLKLILILLILKKYVKKLI